MSTEDDELYQCVGICMVDEASGLCLGCGRPVCEPVPKQVRTPVQAQVCRRGPEEI
ncbi:MAG: DUF1289 domain-containing protein [Betaproteobacteria bacterium]|nr:DUF1289 domain-containing protein [Betaproteobacteria bacterium]